jgi:anti-sigma factor RsiW
MCDERERLIEYVYDECDAAERDRVNRHLESCPTCREEIAGLRRTRQDLLAWEVPDHGSVWKPFAPARLNPWWREVPAWALATAAGAMFCIGVGGGVTGTALMRPKAVQVQAQAAPEAAAATAEAAALRAELSALEQKITLATRADIVRLDQRVQAVSASGAASAGLVRASDAGDHLALYSSVSKDFADLMRLYKRLDKRLQDVEAFQATQAGVPGR